MPFQPGQITNPNGARKERKFYQALLIALNAEGPDIRLRKVAEMLVKQALKGEAWAIKELADRVDGKVPQAQIIQGDEDGGRVRYIAEMPVPALIVGSTGTATDPVPISRRRGWRA